MLKLILIYILPYISAFRFSSWYVGTNYNPEIYPINWTIYTIVHQGGPIIDENGIAKCDPFNIHLSQEAHAYNRKVTWGLGGLNLASILWDNNHILRNNFLQTIPQAMNKCEIDGIQVDYEFGDRIKNLGIVSSFESTVYSKFLSDLKKVIPNKTVSADVSIWGIDTGEWILGILPWINATMLNNGEFDYINTMSYHWSRFGSIWDWKKDAFFIDLWGIDRSRVNIGIPYFSIDKKNSEEPTWGSLSKFCSNITFTSNVCNNITFVGKKMNYKLGQWIKKEGFGGVFPWALNYDSYNDSLAQWLYQGVISCI